RVLVRNTYLRHLAVYVELLADGTPIAPPGWVSRLPAAAQGTLETDTTRFLAILPPARQVAGMPVPSDPVSLSFPVPSWVTGARLVFGGVGIGGYQVMLVAPAALATAVLDYALPAILDGAGAGLSKSAWYQGVLADQAIRDELLVAACALVANPACATLPSLLG